MWKDVEMDRFAFQAQQHARLTRLNKLLAEGRISPGRRSGETTLPWTIKLVACALRLVAGGQRSYTVPKRMLRKLTRLSQTTIGNALRVMASEPRKWITYTPSGGHTSNTYEFTEAFPFPADYFAEY